jgi:DNA-binding NtrC family response regulator
MSRRLLLVEDDAGALVAYREALRLTDWEIMVAQTMAEAKAALVGPGVFQVVLLDICLPDGNGIDLIEHVRQVGAETVVATGRMGAELIAQGGRPSILQNTLVLSKPISLELFQGALDQAYERQRNRIG